MDKLLKTFYRIVNHKEAEGAVDLEFDRRWLVYLVVLILVVGLLIWASTKVTSLYVWGIVFLSGFVGFIGIARSRKKESEKSEGENE